MFHSARVRDLTRIGLFAALIVICAWISIPTKPPFTLQTFAVFAAALILGRRRGTLAVAVYLVAGAMGVPVFAGFGAGIAALFGATGGYIIGFLPAAWIAGYVSEKSSAKTLGKVLGCAAGLLVCYALGTAWFITVYARTGGAVDVLTALGMCVLPFIVPDALKIALAILLSQRFPGAQRR